MRLRHRRRAPRCSTNYDVAEGEGPAPGLAARRPDADAQRARRATSACTSAPAPRVNTPVSACASGNEGIALALDQIRLGRADVVLAGGTEAAIHPLPMAAFANMMALSKNARRPDHASPAPGTPAATASCSVRAPASWCSSPLEHAAGPRRQDLRRGARRRHHRRLPRHRPARPEGRGGARAIKRGARGAGDRAGRHRPHQRPRDLDPAGRHRRGR